MNPSILLTSIGSVKCFKMNFRPEIFEIAYSRRIRHTVESFEQLSGFDAGTLFTLVYKAFIKSWL